MIGKLRGKESRDQRIEKKGLRGGGRIYFGRGGLTGKKAAGLGELAGSLRSFDAAPDLW